MPKSSLIVLVFLTGFAMGMSAQGQLPAQVNGDDSVSVVFPELSNISVSEIEPTTGKILPEPSKVVWWAAAIPGYGQILNQKYWKLPIVYAGFLGCYYAINWNSGRYISYKNAYLDITDNDDTTDSYNDLIPAGRTIDSYGGKSGFTGLLKSGMDKSRYYRDLSVIVTVAYYGLTIIDAFVDAHLADFDISTDLSLQLRPMIHREHTTTFNSSSGYAYGLTGRVKF